MPLSAAQTAVEKVKPRFDQNGDGQHRQHRPGEVQLCGCDNGLHAVLQQGEGHHQNQKPYAQRTQILHPAMAEGMLRIHGLAGHAGGDQRHDAARRVGQVVGRIRQNGQRAAEKADQKFACGQKQIDQNAHAGAQRAVGSTDFSVFRVFIILYKTANQPGRHLHSSTAAPGRGFLSIIPWFSCTGYAFFKKGFEGIFQKRVRRHAAALPAHKV